MLYANPMQEDQEREEKLAMTASSEPLMRSTWGGSMHSSRPPTGRLSKARKHGESDASSLATCASMGASFRTALRSTAGASSFGGDSQSSSQRPITVRLP